MAEGGEGGLDRRKVLGIIGRGLGTIAAGGAGASVPGTLAAAPRREKDAMKAPENLHEEITKEFVREFTHRIKRLGSRPSSQKESQDLGAFVEDYLIAFSRASNLPAGEKSPAMDTLAFARAFREATVIQKVPAHVADELYGLLDDTAVVSLRKEQGEADLPDSNQPIPAHSERKA